MRDFDELGRERHWILEIHLVEPAANMVDFMNGCCEQASWPQAAPSMTGSVALHKDVT
jgi:hypothetical protein